jgi:putative membrane protein
MKRGIQTMLGVALALTVVACGNDTRRSDATTATPSSRDAAVGTSGAARADQEFVEEQLKDGDKEVALSRLAADRATNPEVKKFAQMMVRDHQTAGEELKQAAAHGNLHPEVRTNDDAKDAAENLSKKSGRDFDRAYIDEMIDDHEKALKDLEKKAGDAENPEVRKWAAKTAPKVAAHLATARQLKKELDSQRS